MLWAVQALQQTQTHSIHTASAEPAPHFVHLCQPRLTIWGSQEMPQILQSLLQSHQEYRSWSQTALQSFAPPTGFSIQNSSRLCHLPAPCRHGTLPCSLGAIQQSRTAGREKHHCKASRDSQGTQHQESPCHPLPRGSHQVRGCQEVPSAPRRGTSEGHTAPGWAVLLGRWLCAQGQPWPTAHQHSRANTACRATNGATPGGKTGEKSASPIAGSGGEQESPTPSTPTHRVATAPGWLGTALSVW